MYVLMGDSVLKGEPLMLWEDADVMDVMEGLMYRGHLMYRDNFDVMEGSYVSVASDVWGDSGVMGGALT